MSLTDVVTASSDGEDDVLRRAAVADSLKDDAVGVVERLHAMGVQVA